MFFDFLYVFFAYTPFHFPRFFSLLHSPSSLSQALAFTPFQTSNFTPKPLLPEPVLSSVYHLLFRLPHVINLRRHFVTTPGLLKEDCPLRCIDTRAI